MVTIDVSALPAAELDDDSLWKGGADRYDYSRLPADLRSQAMLAQGTVVEGLSSAVRRVVEAGQALSWAKAELPHGEYLPWVQQACGLKPRYAQKLIRAAEWVNAPHAAHLDAVPDATTLFLLSADTTPEEVREWFMERCAAGEPPSRREVQERKRTNSSPRQPQPTEALALSIIRKGEVERLRQALQLAEQAATVTADQVMAEQRLRELGKVRYIAGAEANFHRMKDGSWVRLPHAGAVDAVVLSETVCDIEASPSPEPEQSPARAWEAAPLLNLEAAAKRLQCSRNTLVAYLSRSGGMIVRNGYKVAREGRGMVRLTPVDQ